MTPTNKIVTYSENASAPLTAKQMTSSVARGIAINLMVLIPCMALTLVMSTMMITVTQFDAMLLNILGAGTIGGMTCVFMFFAGKNLITACRGPVGFLALKKCQIFVGCAAVIALALLSYIIIDAAEFMSSPQIPLTVIASLLAYLAGQLIVLSQLKSRIKAGQSNPSIEPAKNEE